MKILQVSTYDIQGGAAIAAYRLHRGLRERGEDCRLLVQHKSSGDATVIPQIPRKEQKSDDRGFFLQTIIQGHYIDSNRTSISNTIFTLPYPGYNLTHLPPVQEADIINLHWVAGYQSPVTLRKLFSLGKPVVWTLHDQWAFTGGCHYAAGCNKYQDDCALCSQLSDDPFNLPAAVLRDKQALFARADLTLVTPSRWLAGCVRESALFKGLRVEVIPNSLDTGFFCPLPKGKAKRDLGLAPETVALLFGAADCTEKRKGFQALLAAARNCLAHPEFRTLVEGGRLKILCFGSPDSALNSQGLPVIPLGYLDSDERIRTAYSAADIFVLPSLEDNLPNTILEAFSCGTPVVAFAAGGIPEVVRDGENGRLAPVGDSQKLTEAILSLVFHPEESARLGETGRNLMVEEYSLPVQGQRYRELYEQLCRQKGPPKQSTAPPRAAMDPRDLADSGGPEGSREALETDLGVHTRSVFDPILFQALKRYAPTMQRRWQAAEADRAARMDQIVELTRLLKNAEADRAARMDQIVELTRLLKNAEADRVELYKQVAELNAHWTVAIRRRLAGALGRRR